MTTLGAPEEEEEEEDNGVGADIAFGSFFLGDVIFDSIEEEVLNEIDRSLSALSLKEAIEVVVMDMRQMDMSHRQRRDIRERKEQK
jgi:hypothetical protein